MDIKPEDIVVMDFEGDILETKRKPSSEYLLHKIFYEHRKDIKSVVHTHSTYATALSCLQWDLPAIHYFNSLQWTR